MSRMKAFYRILPALAALVIPCSATTIMVVPVFEPLSMHGTDGDDAISEIGEALQATVMPRPMALSGAFPEVLIESIRTPHPLPSNNPNYQVQEANLFVLCNIGVKAVLTEEALVITLDISEISIPFEVDLTTRQILRIGIVAVRKTLEEYQRPQPNPINVRVRIAGAVGDREPLRDVGAEFTLPATMSE
ncbi:MAG: hypothetical protein ACNA8L_01165 [Luteolibacter sp.]